MSTSLFVIRKIEQGEEQQVCLLVKHVFEEFVAPLYEMEGVEEFLRYIDPERMVNRLSRNHFVLLAEKAGRLLGMIEIRDFSHISLLFVSGNAQRQGIAKRLLNKALEICKTKLALTEMSVNSSPNAVDVYKKLGFKVKGNEQLKNGICFIPMQLRINEE